MRPALMVIIVAVTAIIATVLVMLSITYGAMGVPYVTGHFTGPSAVTGMPDYYEMLSDGTYIPVPWSIYSTAPYGSTLSYSSSRWTILDTPRTRAGYTPDIDYSTWKSARIVTKISSYRGMSLISKGVTVYKSSSGLVSRPSLGRR